LRSGGYPILDLRHLTLRFYLKLILWAALR
jgi:hypothetical protein